MGLMSCNAHEWPRELVCRFPLYKPTRGLTELKNQIKYSLQRGSQDQVRTKKALVTLTTAAAHNVAEDRKLAGSGVERRHYDLFLKKCGTWEVNYELN